MSVDHLESLNSSSIDPSWLKLVISVREIFGEQSAYPKEGVPQRVFVGPVSIPILYVCGLSDHSDLCGRPVPKTTAKYCRNGYRYLEVDCGHNVLKCDRSSETARV